MLMGVGLRKSTLGKEGFMRIYKKALDEKNVLFIAEIEKYFGESLLVEEIEFVDKLAFYTQLPQKKSEVG